MIRPVRSGKALIAEMAEPVSPGHLALWWLGQSGFAFRWADHAAYIDPYLSEHLTAKYAHSNKPHIRMTEAPIRGSDIRNAGLVFCTHSHSDHLDPGTLPDLLTASPACRLVLPRAIVTHALSLGLPAERLVPLNAGEHCELDGLEVTAVASSHEQLDVTPGGLYPYLGYVLGFGPVTAYHSGDTIPYEGLVERIAPQQVDLALLPINGRDARRHALGTPGNLTSPEAAELAWRIGARVLIPHHYDMFTFNTGNPQELVAHVRRRRLPAAVKILRCGERWLYTLDGVRTDAT